MVDKCTEDAAKPSTLDRMGLPFKSPKKRVVDVLQSSVQGSLTELRGSVDKLEEKWKENHGPVSQPLHAGVCRLPFRYTTLSKTCVVLLITTRVCLRYFRPRMTTPQYSVRV